MVPPRVYVPLLAGDAPGAAFVLPELVLGPIERDQDPALCIPIGTIVNL